MQPKRQQQISDVYHDALGRTPNERQAFLDQACAGDEDLREEVESLLACESEAARFMETALAGDAGLIGQQIGSYTILGRIDGGGMGDVYRARDSHLGRDVAIKVLPRHFMDDAERRARFEREARVLAALNHPHIGTIHGFERGDQISAIVMELVDGPTLAQRLEQGPLPLAEALAIARQIADALDAAHEKGIVHRDLKPSNIVLKRATGGFAGSPDDVRVKLIDFGLAKAIAPDGIVAHAGGTTEDGRILGTPAYMSPEQARGLPVDKRTDIWAFGCVLFEMLSGRRAFEGATVSDTLARVIEREPSWDILPANTPPSVRQVLERCLRKDPKRRLRDIADAMAELNDGTDSPAPTADALPPRSRLLPWLGWVSSGLLGAVLIWSAAPRSPVLSDPVSFELTLPARTEASSDFAMSPNGHYIAVVLRLTGGPTSVWVRSLDTLEWQQLPGTEGAQRPFWKPDSQAVGFFAGGSIKTVRISGATSAVTVCRGLGSGTWNRDGIIVFGGADGLLAGTALQKVSDGGGTPEPLTTLAGREFAHDYPVFLPDSTHFLYLALSADSKELRVGSLTSPDSVSLGPFESNAEYAAGQLFSVRAGSFKAQAFDIRTLRLTGPTSFVAPKVGSDLRHGLFSVSQTGALAYRAAEPSSRLTWFDRGGQQLGTVGEPGHYFNLDLSPDDQHVAVSRGTPNPSGWPQVDLWLIDIAQSGVMTRLTDDVGADWDPAWSPTGSKIAFTHNNSIREPPGLYVRPAEASGKSNLLLVQHPAGIVTPDWSHDERYLVFSRVAKGDQDLWILPTEGGQTPMPFLATRHIEWDGMFSPNDKWIAYASNASGRPEVYLRPFPASVRPRETVVSREGGRTPRWRGDGKEIFFLTPPRKMMSATIDPITGNASAPRTLFNLRTQLLGGRPYAVTKDGQRFLMPIPEPEAPIVFHNNWRALGTQ